MVNVLTVSKIAIVPFIAQSAHLPRLVDHVLMILNVQIWVEDALSVLVPVEIVSLIQNALELHPFAPHSNVRLAQMILNVRAMVKSVMSTQENVLNVCLMPTVREPHPFAAITNASHALMMSNAKSWVAFVLNQQENVETV